MSYSPPTTFVDGTILTAADLEGNAEALRVYLHRGIASGDLAATQWIDTRHVQPPAYEPFSGVQHGVTGHQGGQWAGGTGIRMTFATKYLSGQGRQSSSAAHGIPNSSFTLQIRRSAKILFHYWWDLENGKDESTASYQAATADRQVWIMPWFGSVNNAVGSYSNRAQETRNNDGGVSTNYPLGLDRTLVAGGGYGSKQGTMALAYSGVGEATFGLAAHSATDRCGIVEWGVSIEVFYL
jgi:hypothetical protein